MRPLLPTLPLALLLLAGRPAGAADRTMSWRALEVDARLDARGDLHVRERQELRFDGAWNGGERRFRVGPGQRLRFERLLRETPAGPVEVTAGDLGTVDRYAFAGPATLRWRSRAAGAPPFAGDVLTYVLEYTLERVLVRGDDGAIVLAHDLAFPDREWPIARARGRVVLDGAWALADGALEADAADLPPGAGLVVRARLRWAGAGQPPEVAAPAAAERDAEPPPAPAEPLPPGAPLALAAALALALLAAAVAVYRHALRQGQLAPVPPPDAVDERFLAEHVLAWPPEVVAAAWHGRVGEAAVAAVVARLCAAGRIEARVDGKTLRLRLRAARTSFQGSDEVLVRKLFPDGDAIDTGRLRERYRGTGFDPADCIREQTEHRLRNVDGPLARQRTWPRAAAGVLVALAGAAGLLASFSSPPVDPFWYLVRVLILPVTAALVAFALAGWLARAVRGLRTPAALLAVLLAGWGLAIVRAAGAVGVDETRIGLAAGLLAWAAAALGVVAFGRTRRLPDAILFRKRLAAARGWLARELERPAPRLRDAWAPWLVALGLSRHADHWFAANARAAPEGDASGDLGRPTGTGGTAPAPDRWTGDGGLFAGGGASGGWAALGAVATSYSSPSSSSSDSSSSSSSDSGSSSSGGGGGGGW